MIKKERDWEYRGYIFGLGVCVAGLFCVALGSFEMQDLTSVGLAVITLGISYITIIIALSSNKKMKALAKLNFDEKMAMMIIHKGNFEKTMLETVIERCKYDLRAMSHLIHWAKNEPTAEDKEKLIKYVIDIIEGYQGCKKCDENEKYSKNICDIIEISLEIVPDHKKLINLKKEMCSYGHRE